jgi:hypothetical protein
MRFSLRTLFAIVTCAAIWLAINVSCFRFVCSAALEWKAPILVAAVASNVIAFIAVVALLEKPPPLPDRFKE